VGEALGHAHDQGIVDRDIKPENIMVLRAGQAKLADFGLAAILRETTLTQTAATMGTVYYMSPEQVRGEKLDARSDIWSLGATLYEMLGGKRPFQADTPVAVMNQILTEDPTPIAGVPEQVAQTLERCLRKDPQERLQSMRELITCRGATGPETARGSTAVLPDLPSMALDAELAAFAHELVTAGTSTDESDDPTLVGEEGKIVQILRRMVWLLHTSGEYDLHLEPIWEGGQEVALLRMRAGEEWREVRQIPRALHEELVLKCKQQAGLSIEERSRPQAGSASLVYGDTLVPMRVSVSPTLNGERVAIRVVPTCSRSLADLGLADSPLAKWLDQSQGLVLITGPTGSGKVTTQAACVRQLAERKLSIVSAEDPLEYLFPRGVAHLKLEQFTRAEGLRALLQQAPDVIVLGELETDPELARSAAVAADKGHLVLAYQHGHDSISALYDFLEWGVERSVLTATLVGIVNQHLLARLCDACKAKHVPDPRVLHLLASFGDRFPARRIAR
jgi:type II secretory ATPase GspE/PulE/Tfp pilus assembly ATPase PilB-like protein